MVEEKIIKNLVAELKYIWGVGPYPYQDEEKEGKEAEISEAEKFLDFLFGDFDRYHGKIHLWQVFEGSGLTDHYLHGPKHMREEIVKLKEGQKDVYITPNLFLNAKNKARGKEFLSCINAICVDLDVYKKGMTPEQAERELLAFLRKKNLPEPNAILHSGRGLWAIWLVKPKFKKTRKEMQGLVRYVDALLLQITEVLSCFGADPQACHANNFVRLPGSVNSKNNKSVRVTYLHNKRISMSELFNAFGGKKEKGGAVVYLPTVNKYPKAMPKNNIDINELYYQDLLTLIQLRFDEKVPEGERDKYGFLLANFALAGKEETEFAEILEKVREYLDGFSFLEIIRSAWEAVKKGKIYHYRKKTLIKRLGITEEEMKHLKVLRNCKTKKETNGRKAEKEQLKQKLFEMYRTEKDVSMLARKLGISRTTAFRWLKEMKTKQLENALNSRISVEKEQGNGFIPAENYRPLVPNGINGRTGKTCVSKCAIYEILFSRSVGKGEPSPLISFPFFASVLGQGGRLVGEVGKYSGTDPP